MNLDYVRHEPTHLVISARSLQSVCGIDEPVPSVLLQFAARHVEGWGMTICERCLDGLGLLVPDDLRAALDVTNRR